jgi:hypothetical protein
MILRKINSDFLFFSINQLLKGLSYEIDFENGVNKGHGWFLNFSEAPLIFGWK